jgi:hypothetical protein
MNILVFCPDSLAREAISHHVIELGNYQLIFAESEKLTVSLALYNEIKLLLLFQPSQIRSLIDIKDFLRQKRRHMRVRILPDTAGALMPGWQEVVTSALKPVRKRKPRERLTHPRFKWKPS